MHYNVRLVEVWIYKHAWTAHKAGYSTGQCWDNICDIVYNYSKDNSAILSQLKLRLDAVLMLAYHLRRWPNFDPTLGQCFVCARALMVVWARQIPVNAEHLCSFYTMLVDHRRQWAVIV